MAKTFTEDEDLVTLANKVIADHKMTYMDSVVARYLLVGPHISKTVHGRCIKANNELKHFGNFDYLIEFSQDIWVALDDQTRYILMYHELSHVLVTMKKDKQVLSIAGHDLQDFQAIIKQYGVDWFQQFKDVVAATYDIQGADKDKITI
jgi:hypothetical protein